MTPPVVAIIGPSDSGKTKVAVAMIEFLAALGYRIAAVKHSAHGHQVDRPATDSARLYAAGAYRVFLTSPGQLTSIGRTDTDTPLEEIVASLDSSYNLVLVEGFKDSAVPKIMVLGTEPLSPPPENVIAVVGDHATAEDVPCYTFEEMDGLAGHIHERMLASAPVAPAVSMMVDGVPIPLGSFSSSTLTEMILGFLKALKDVPGDPSGVHIVLKR